MYKCECGKTFDKANSLNAHYSHCIIHRKGKAPIDRFENVRSWSTGLTKETHPGLASMAKKNTGKKKKWTIEQRQNLSKRLKGVNGGYRENSNRWKGLYVIVDNQKIWLDSSYELRFVNLLTKFNIKWVRNYEKFEYTHIGENRKYIPDFYIPEIDQWIEVKGWVKERDHSKWKDFPHKLKIILKKTLDKLEELPNKEAVMVELVYTQD